MAWMPIKRLLKQSVGAADPSPAYPPASEAAWLSQFEKPAAARRENRGPARGGPRAAGAGAPAGRRPPEPPAPAAAHPYSAFDAIGQRNEMVRVRISQMMERLDDLKSLQADFTQILEPLANVATSCPGEDQDRRT